MNRKKHIIKSNLLNLICLSFISSQSYNYSVVMPVPDLSFHSSIFYGLDILEQMDFKPLYDKSIGVFTNQTAVNRKGVHLLDLLKMIINFNMILASHIILLTKLKFN